MNGTGEFEPGFMAEEQGDQEVLTGMQHVSQVRSTRRDDGSLVSPESAPKETLLEVPGVSDRRVERLRMLKEAIDGGRYFVPSSDVAERVMASMSGESVL
jgi:anti-sigma28 factor (negative regulator of flagellin synthesis)